MVSHTRHGLAAIGCRCLALPAVIVSWQSKEGQTPIAAPTEVAIPPIETILFAVAAALLLCVVAGLWRAVRGPTRRDRLSAFILLGTTGTALLVVLGSATGVAAFRDAAIAVVALATVVVVVLGRGERA